MDGRTHGYDVVFYHEVPHVLLDSMMTIAHKAQDTRVASDARHVVRARIERAGRVRGRARGSVEEGRGLTSSHRIASRVGRRASVVVSSVVSSNPTGIRLELDAI